MNPDTFPSGYVLTTSSIDPEGNSHQARLQLELTGKDLAVDLSRQEEQDNGIREIFLTPLLRSKSQSK